MTPIGERFWPKVDMAGGPDACWPWLAAMYYDDYGAFAIRSNMVRRAHRVAYELAVGPIPEGLTIDHLCENTRCVNPAHLEPVTAAENTRRWSERMTHCKRGHEFTPENTYWRTGRPGRNCRACRAAAGRAHRARQKVGAS